jgi:cytochrome P450
MPFVWSESLQQAEAMLESWAGAAEAGIPSMQTDTRTLSLNVMASIGLRKSYPFQGSANPATKTTGEANNYRDSLAMVLDNIIPLMVFPWQFMTLPLVPKKWAKVGRAAYAFKKQMQDMIDEERAAIARGSPGTGGVTTSLVKAFEVHEREAAVNTPKRDKKGLSREELLGDLFIISFAGHDTTANTLAFTVLLLIVHPEIQAWVSEEINAVTGSSPVEEWDYKTTFPQLKRCRAILFETLRLFPPVPAIPKVTPLSGGMQTLRVGQRTLVIPPGIGLMSSVYATHTHPSHWTDPLEWQPKRWIVNAAPAASPTAEQIKSEDMFVPDKLIFLPFSEGPQSCLGRKLSEVEFTAVLACLLRTHRLSAQKEPHENDGALQKRVKRVIDDIDLELLTKMRDANRIRVVCRRG